MKHHFLLFSVFTFISAFGNILYAKNDKSSDKSSSCIRDSVVHIIYDCEKQEFEKGYPHCVTEYSQVVVKYTHLNPFLHNSHLTVEQIDGKWDDGMDSYYKISKSATDEKAATTAASDNAIEERFKNIDFGTLKYTGGGNEYRKVTKKDSIMMLVIAKKSLLIELQEKLRSAEQSIYAINEVMQLDTVIKTCRKNERNRSEQQMTDDIASRITFDVSSGSDIQFYFDSTLQTLHDSLRAIGEIVVALEDVNKLLTAKGSKYSFTTTITDIKTNLAKLNDAYSGTKQETLLKNVTAIVNNYQNTVGVPYEVDGDSVVCARGEYLQLKDAGMKIDFAPIKIRRASRIDFSVGLAFTMGDVNGWNYTLNKVNDTTTYLITDKENKMILPSPVVMMHWYVTQCKNTAWALSFGVSPDIATLTDAKFFLGGSMARLSSGKVLRRFIISGGVCVGTTDVLKAKYRMKDRLPDNNFNSFGNISDSDLTEKSYRAGAFMSLTWNLGGS